MRNGSDSCSVRESARPRSHASSRSVEPPFDAFFAINTTADQMANLIGSCEHCGGTFRYQLIHNGFNDSTYSYCDHCSFTVLLNGWNQTAQRVGLQIHRRITPDVENLLKPCPCGNAFRASADPKCPHCARTLSAVKATTYIERDAP